MGGSHVTRINSRPKRSARLGRPDGSFAFPDAVSSQPPEKLVMSRTSPSHHQTGSGGVLLRIRSLLTRPIRLERRGIDWHFVFDPAPGSNSTPRTAVSPRSP